jgi:N-acetyl sugar amidotransferase
MLKVCKRCLYHEDHPLGITFNELGICSGCQIHEEKDALDWGSRFSRLEELVAPYRGGSKSKYDCVVPVSGGGDSHYIVHVVKHELGLNPLLVNNNIYFNTPLGIRNLANLRIKFNCDFLQQNVDVRSVRKIVRSGMAKFGNPYWHVQAGNSAFPVQTAVRLGIPLIIWGAHQGMEQVGMFSHLHEVEMSRRYRKDHDLFGYEANDLLSGFDLLREKDVDQYLYPDDDRINSVGVRGIYLNNYIRWDPKAFHEQMMNLYDYKSASFSRTFDTYDFVHCYVYMGVHDLFKYHKFGYSKVTDHACREIRHKRLTRDEGVALVRAFRDAPDPNRALFEKFMGLTTTGLDFLLDSWRSEKFWAQNGRREWDFVDYLDKGRELPAYDHQFCANSVLSYGEDSDRYITVGKGFPL